jgi:hypothetical protein
MESQISCGTPVALTEVYPCKFLRSNGCQPLTAPTTVKPIFVADVAGTYVASLIVNDGKVNSATVTVVIITSAVPGVVVNGGQLRPLSA